MRGFGRRLVTITAVLMACLSCCAPPARRPRSARARLLQDRRVPARVDPAGIQAIGARRRQQLRRRRHRGRRPFTPRTSPATPPSCACRPPATSSTRRSRPPSRRYIQAGGGYAGVHAASDTEYDVALVRRPRRRVLPQPPRGPDGDGRSRRPRPPVDQAPAGALVALRRVVRLQPTARQVSTCSRPSTKTTYAGGGDGGRHHPIAWCHDYQAAAPGTPASATPTSPTRTPRSGAPARRHPVAAGAVANDCGGRSGATSRRPSSTTDVASRWAWT